MDDPLKSAQPVDQEMTGEPVEAHGYVVTPVARVRGKLGVSENEEGRWRYGWMAVRPVKASVIDRSGNTQEVRIVDAQQKAITGMLAVGLVVAAVSLLISLLVGARRGSSGPLED
jgi:predicted carbohydrate-binding protein with CBM5 and CBM33 domain